MVRVTFSGASDDLVELDGDVREEHPADGNDGATFVFGGLRVRVEYGDSGCWHVDVGQVDEDAKVTARVVSLEPGDGTSGFDGGNGARPYSMALTVEAPDGTAVVREHVD